MPNMVCGDKKSEGKERLAKFEEEKGPFLTTVGALYLKKGKESQKK